MTDYDDYLQSCRERELLAEIERLKMTLEYIGEVVQRAVGANETAVMEPCKCPSAAHCAKHLLDKNVFCLRDVADEAFAAGRRAGKSILTATGGEPVAVVRDVEDNDAIN